MYKHKLLPLPVVATFDSGELLQISQAHVGWLNVFVKLNLIYYYETIVLY